jgi:uncharacterized protein (TIGR04141 family)
MSEKLQIAIYKIEGGLSLDELCQKAKEKKFAEQSLAFSSKNGFELKLYYQSKPSFPKWKGFAASITTDNQEIIKPYKSGMEGFVLYLSKDDKVYAVTGGHGHFVVQDCIDTNFGIEVFARLIKKEDKILKSTREKSLVGGILGTTKYFRNNFNLFDNDSFGKIYQEVKARLNKEILVSKLGFTEEDIKKESLCVAKSSFRINKDITCEQLLKVIEGCESLLESAQPIPINSVEKLAKKKNQSLIDKLTTELFSQLWKRYSDPAYEIDFDLCHYEWEQYLTASEYIASRGNKGNNAFGELTFEELSNVDMLFEAIKEQHNKPDDQEAFEKLLRNLKIISFDEEGQILTQG